MKHLAGLIALAFSYWGLVPVIGRQGWVGCVGLLLFLICYARLTLVTNEIFVAAGYDEDEGE